MTKAVAVLRLDGGQPVGVVTGPVGMAVDPGVVLVRAYNLLAKQGDFGLYLVAGLAAELAALDASANCAGCVALAWPAAGATIPAGVRTRCNTWLTARSLPTIPAGWTWLQLLRRLDTRFDASGYDLADPDQGRRAKRGLS